MGYLHKRFRRGRPAHPAMGDFSDTIANAISSASGAVGAALNVAGDPYLPEVICRVSQLHAIKAGQSPPACADTPPGLPGGVGLDKAIFPLRMFVYAEQHPWVYPLAAAVLIGLPMWIGYELGSTKG